MFKRHAVEIYVVMAVVSFVLAQVTLLELALFATLGWVCISMIGLMAAAQAHVVRTRRR